MASSCRASWTVWRPAFHAWSTRSCASARPSTCSHWNSTPGEGYLEYDRLIVSPGVEFQWEQVDGLAEAQDRVLHAWKAGRQTVQLRPDVRRVGKEVRSRR